MKAHRLDGAQSHRLGAAVGRWARRHDGWHRVPLASLDFETTGVDPFHDRVLSYALLDQPGFEITGLVDPGVPIPPASADVHGITEAMLADAPSSAEGLAVVVDWVQSLVDRQVGLVVFNAAYDLTMLRAEADAARPRPARLVAAARRRSLRRRLGHRARRAGSAPAHRRRLLLRHPDRQRARRHLRRPRGPRRRGRARRPARADRGHHDPRAHGRPAHVAHRARPRVERLRRQEGSSGRRPRRLAAGRLVARCEMWLGLGPVSDLLGQSLPDVAVQFR